jgi:hypothetical protein
MPDLLRRYAALEKTAAKYEGEELDFRQADCVRMARSHLVAMGHRKLLKLPRYTSHLGARRALKEAGFASIEAMLDATLPRIPPARILLGDLALVRGGQPGNEDEESDLDSIAIWGGQKFLGWWEGRFVRNLIVTEVKAAYRA